MGKAKGMNTFEIIAEKNEQIRELNKAIQFAVQYLSSSDIGQVKMVVQSLELALKKYRETQS